jgi:hypothetical protein
VSTAATDDDRPASELRIAQKLDGRIEGVHIEMRDQADGIEGHCGGPVTKKAATV